MSLVQLSSQRDTDLVRRAVAAHQDGSTLAAAMAANLWKADRADAALRALSGSGAVSDTAVAGPTPSELEAAIAKQALRIVFLTLGVIDDISLAKGTSVPRPNIPGTRLSH